MTTIEFWCDGAKIAERSFDAVLPAAGDELDIRSGAGARSYRIRRLYKHFSEDNHPTPRAELEAVGPGSPGAA